MALWQIDFFILPQDALNNQELFKISEEHSFDDSQFWQSLKESPSNFDSVGLFLPRSKSWASCLIMFGDETSNRFEIMASNDFVESVSFRIDFTSAYDDVLRQIIEFCILNGFIILDEKLQIVPLNFEAAKRVIEDAPQVRKYNSLL